MLREVAAPFSPPPSHLELWTRRPHNAPHARTGSFERRQHLANDLDRSVQFLQHQPLLVRDTAQQILSRNVTLKLVPRLSGTGTRHFHNSPAVATMGSRGQNRKRPTCTTTFIVSQPVLPTLLPAS